MAGGAQEGAHLVTALGWDGLQDGVEDLARAELELSKATDASDATEPRQAPDRLTLVRRIVADDPTVRGPELAQQLGVSVRTAQRLRAQVTA